MFTFLSAAPVAKMIDKNQESLRPEGRGENDRDVKLYLNDQGSKRVSSTWNNQERNLVSEMCKIRRNEKTGFEGDLEKVLQDRAEIYGNQLETTWFSHGSDLSIKLKSQRERNIARSMLVGAPVLVAQKGAQMLRKRMLEGETQVLENLQ